MSLAIDIDRITAVLLTDGWHTVAENSFALDAYEYMWNATKDHVEWPHLGGNSGICATGFRFTTTDNDCMAGPLTAIHAVRHRRSNQ